MKILMIDDLPENIRLVKRYFKYLPYELIYAYDAEKGIEMARKERPDLILMDIRMPGIDGLQATKIIKADESINEIPIIAMTAEANQDECTAAGCDDYIRKPTTKRHLFNVIQNFISLS